MLLERPTAAQTQFHGQVRPRLRGGLLRRSSGGRVIDVEEQPITERRRVLARLKRVKVMLPEATA